MPRAGLSPGAVVDEAATVVDEMGFGNLTLAALAKRLDVALPSLYKHVRGVDDLDRRLAVRVARELGDAIRRAATGRATSRAVHAVAAAYRQYAHTHPGRYGYVVRARPDDAEHREAASEILDVLYDVFAGYGIAGDDAVDAARFVRSTLHGFVSLDSGGGFGMPYSVDRSFERMVDALEHALAGWSAQAS